MHVHPLFIQVLILILSTHGIKFFLRPMQKETCLWIEPVPVRCFAVCEPLHCLRYLVLVDLRASFSWFLKWNSRQQCCNSGKDLL